MRRNLLPAVILVLAFGIVSLYANLTRLGGSSQVGKDQLALTITPSNGLVGYWSLDEGSGSSAADASGAGNNGTLSGTS